MRSRLRSDGFEPLPPARARERPFDLPQYVAGHRDAFEGGAGFQLPVHRLRDIADLDHRSHEINMKA